MGKEWLWFNRKLKHMTGKPKDRKVFTTVIRSVDDASWGCFCKIKLFRIFILQMKCGFKTEKYKNVLEKYCPFPWRSTKKFSTWSAFNTEGMWRIKEKKTGKKHGSLQQQLKWKRRKLSVKKSWNVFIHLELRYCCCVTKEINSCK